MFIISVNPRLRRITLSRELLKWVAHFEDFGIEKNLIRGDLEMGRFAFSKVIENE